VKKIVLNACGVKSLGGLKLFLEAFDFFSKTDSKILVLYSESEFYKDLNNQFYENPRVKFYKTTNKRYLHPFLNYFLPKSVLEEINNGDAIIHFGNFGFKTLKKSFVLIQNILPLVKKDTRNVILKILMKRSMKFSNYILIQLEHLKQDIDKNFHSKIIQIGETTSSNVQIANKSGKIVLFGSNVENKNFNFMKSVLENLPNKKKITVINPTTGMESFNVVRTETHFETLELISENEIYFHASEYETVGLPLYEAQNLGLKVVAPICSYTQYFSPESIFLYEMNNLKDALKKIEDAKSSDIESIDTLNYSENWKIVLDNI
tara:strand:- start:3912 stop:4871 length:960 start_codon:yes stop_codon:yes gene_type:complete